MQSSRREKAKKGALKGAFVASGLYQQIYGRLPRSMQKDKYVQMSGGLFLGLGMSLGSLYGLFQNEQPSRSAASDENLSVTAPTQPQNDSPVSAPLYQQHIQKMLTAHEKERSARLNQRHLGQKAAHAAAEFVKAKQKTQDQLNYALAVRKNTIDHILKELENHRLHLTKQGGSGQIKAQALKILIRDLQFQTKRSQKAVHSLANLDQSTEQLIATFKKTIQKHLGPENSQLKMHRDWATQIGTFILNALMTLTIAPLLTHKAKYNSWFFRPKTTTETVIEKVEENFKALTAIKINRPASAA
jgi:hypothetical protein